MKSIYADRFNHDEDASEYDEDVRNEKDPIRTGYEAVLTWVIESAKIEKQSSVLELGSGSGNLSRRIKECRVLTTVDISEKMEELAKSKLTHIKNRLFVKADFLEFFEKNSEEFDVIISTYSIHHLSEEEKIFLLKEVWDHLKPSGKAVFGDLMFECKSKKEVKREEYTKKEDFETAKAIEEEFLWYIDTAEAYLKSLGFKVITRKFSDLSYGIVAEKPMKSGH